MVTKQYYYQGDSLYAITKQKFEPYDLTYRADTYEPITAGIISWKFIASVSEYYSQNRKQRIIMKVLGADTLHNALYVIDLKYDHHKFPQSAKSVFLNYRGFAIDSSYLAFKYDSLGRQSCYYVATSAEKFTANPPICVASKTINMVRIGSKLLC